jgi:hypothetical protein
MSDRTHGGDENAPTEAGDRAAFAGRVVIKPALALALRLPALVTGYAEMRRTGRGAERMGRMRTAAAAFPARGLCLGLVEGFFVGRLRVAPLAGCRVVGV